MPGKKLKLLIFVIIIPACISLGGLLRVLLLKDLQVFPGTDFNLTPFTDENDKFGKGRSGIEEFEILADRLIMSYTLKSGTRYSPYIGININRKNSHIDIRGYDYIHIKIDSKKTERLRLFILLYNEGITTDFDYLSYLYLYKEISVWQSKNEYTLKLNDFYIPDWWHDITNISESDERIEKDFTRTAFIVIQSENGFPPDITDTIELRGLRFSKNRFRYGLYAGIVLLGYFIIIISYGLWKAYKKRLMNRMQKKVILYRSLEIDAEQNPDARRIIEYLKRHFQNPDLSVTSVSTACSVPAYKIPLILKKTFQLSFPGYLNSLRLEEAKRLLRETDLNITEIVMKAGYNSISHFNNLFRFIENITPGEFRKKAENEK